MARHSAESLPTRSDASDPEIPDQPLRSPEESSPSLTLRSLLIGTLGVIVICATAPYNDYVVVNTPMVGSYLPLGAVLALFFLTVVVNAPLSRFAPRQALSAREMAVILAMLLAGSALPTTGLMRIWMPMLVAPFRFGQEDLTFWQIFSKLSLPGWLFPVDDIENGRNSPIVNFFYNRVPAEESIPYAAWIPPLLGWGIFIAAWLTAMLAMAVIVVP